MKISTDLFGRWVYSSNAFKRAENSVVVVIAEIRIRILQPVITDLRLDLKPRPCITEAVHLRDYGVNYN